MKKIITIFIIFSLALPLTAAQCLTDCLSHEELPACINKCQTPCYDNCIKQNPERQCRLKCFPQALCLADCLETNNASLCKGQCTASLERCSKTCVDMCEKVYCDSSGCQKDCKTLCKNDCNPENKTDSTENISQKPDQSSSFDNQPIGGEEISTVSGEEEAGSKKDQKTGRNSGTQQAPDNCFSVCHKYCTVPCTDKCSDRECSMQCYSNCSEVCRLECAGAERNTPNIQNNTRQNQKYEEDGSGWTFEFWAMLGFFLIMLTTIGSWQASRTNRKENLKIIDRIEQIYNQYKNNNDLCISKLEQIRQTVKDEYAQRKIDENTFNFLIDRLEHYVQELEYSPKNNGPKNNQ